MFRVGRQRQVARDGIAGDRSSTYKDLSYEDAIPDVCEAAKSFQTLRSLMRINNPSNGMRDDPRTRRMFKISETASAFRI